MANIKRTSKKNGNFGRTTTTQSSKGGVTRSTSNKPPGAVSRRTVSFNNRTGKTRTTYSTKLGGGWTSISSKTTGGSTRRKSSGRSRSGGSVNMAGLLTIPIVFFIGIALMIMYFWPVTIPYIVGAVIGLMIVSVIIHLLIIAIPWILLGVVLYGLYSVVNFIR